MALDTQLVQKKIEELKIPNTSVAALVGISGSQLSDYLRGAKPISAEKLTMIRGVLADVEAIVEKSQPLVLDLRNPILIRRWIDSYRENSLRIEVKDIHAEQSRDQNVVR